MIREDGLDAIGYDFGNDIIDAVAQGDRPVANEKPRRVIFGCKGNESGFEGVI